MKLLDSVSVTVNVSSEGSVEIADLYWKDEKYYGIWRPIEGSTLGSGQGNVETLVSWSNLTSAPVQGHIGVSVRKANDAVITLSLWPGSTNDVVLNPGEAKSVRLTLPLLAVPQNEQGVWEYMAELTDTMTEDLYDTASCTFIVGSIQSPLSCSDLGYTKYQLRTALENGTIASNWWNYDDDFRRHLGICIAQYFSVEEFGEPKYIAYSPTIPTWDPNFDKNHDQINAFCGSETGLRYSLIGGQYQPENTCWYYTKISGDYYWKPARQTKPFLLPVGAGSVNWTSPDGSPYGHRVAAIQVGTNTSEMDSWVFFQFDSSEILPGDPQMVIPGNTESGTVIGFNRYCYVEWGTSLGYWEY